VSAPPAVSPRPAVTIIVPFRNAERTIGGALGCADLFPQQVGGHVAGSDDAETARVAYSGDKLPRRRPSHSSLDDGMLDAEQTREAGL